MLNENAFSPQSGHVKYDKILLKLVKRESYK
jgi:hypothetical protein